MVNIHEKIYLTSSKNLQFIEINKLNWAEELRISKCYKQAACMMQCIGVHLLDAYNAIKNTVGVYDFFREFYCRNFGE